MKGCLRQATITRLLSLSLCLYVFVLTFVSLSLRFCPYICLFVFTFLSLHLSLCLQVFVAVLTFVSLFTLSRLLRFSVTRFGEISPLWQNFKGLWQFVRVYLVFGKIFNLLRKFIMKLGEMSLLQMAKYRKSNLVVWSPCLFFSTLID